MLALDFEVRGVGVMVEAVCEVHVKAFKAQSFARSSFRAEGRSWGEVPRI